VQWWHRAGGRATRRRWTRPAGPRRAGTRPRRGSHPSAPNRSHHRGHRRPHRAVNPNARPAPRCRRQPVTLMSENGARTVRECGQRLAGERRCPDCQLLPPHRRRRKLYRLRGGAYRHGTNRARIEPPNCPTPPLPSSPRAASVRSFTPHTGRDLVALRESEDNYITQIATEGSPRRSRTMTPPSPRIHLAPTSRSHSDHGWSNNLCAAGGYEDRCGRKERDVSGARPVHDDRGENAASTGPWSPAADLDGGVHRLLPATVTAGTS
jgi:hypothetical protein